MAVNFATPIAHQTSANYTAFTGAIGLGRPFRQPLTSAAAPTPASFARGLELFLSAAGDIARLYAWLDSTVTFVAATTAAPGDRLVLTVDPLVLSAPGATTLASLPMLERRPQRLTFENVDRAAVQIALETLLNNAHTAATGAESTWHPSMRMLVSGGAAAPVTLKAYIDAIAATAAPTGPIAPTAAAITTLVTAMLTPPATGVPVLTQVRVRAGEIVGRAAAYLPTDPLPAPEPFPLGAATDAARARRVTVVTEDNSGDILDPVYYLHLFMWQMLVTPATAQIVVTMTNTIVGANFVHPLVTLLPALNWAPDQPARAQVAGAFRYAIGALGNWHGYPFPPAAAVSLGEWRYSPAGTFEARVAATGAAIATAFASNHTTKVTNFWTTYADLTNTICARLQVPVELVVALACNESLPSLSPRSIRLEPLLERPRRRNRTTLRASTHAALELPYDLVVGSEAAVTGVVHHASDQSLLHVTFAAAREINANRFSSKGFQLLVGNADRLQITANTGSATPVTAYSITVRDLLYAGGSLASSTQAGGTTTYYSIASRAAGNAAEAPVLTVLGRAGVLRRLRFRVGTNTLPAGTAVEVLRNGTSTTITATLGGSPATAADDLVNSVAVASGDRISLRVVTPAAAAPTQLRDIACTLQFAPEGAGNVYVLEGYSPPTPGVPNPLIGVAAVRPGRTLTWDQLGDVMDALGGARVSPGLLQTLISTALGVMAYLDRLDPGIYAAVGVTPAPATPAGFIEWLCTPAHSILLGAAFMRQLFHRPKDTRFDLPVVGAAYNTGGVTTVPNRRWGFGDSTFNYPDHIAPYFNAAVAYFDGAAPPPIAPAVRFMS